MDKGFSFGDDDNVGELEDLDKLKDDLESTKQLLELEVRSKALLEKDNKRLQHEIERLKVEFANVKTAGTESQAPPDILNNILTRERKESISKERRDSMIEKRKSLADNQISDIIASSQQPTKVITEEVPEEVTETTESKSLFKREFHLIYMIHKSPLKYLQFAVKFYSFSPPKRTLKLA